MISLNGHSGIPGRTFLTHPHAYLRKLCNLSFNKEHLGWNRFEDMQILAGRHTFCHIADYVQYGLRSVVRFNEHGKAEEIPQENADHLGKIDHEKHVIYMAGIPPIHLYADGDPVMCALTGRGDVALGEITEISL